MGHWDGGVWGSGFEDMGIFAALYGIVLAHIVDQYANKLLHLLLQLLSNIILNRISPEPLKYLRLLSTLPE